MKYKIAVVGATGNVGKVMLNILAERNFPYKEIVALASKNSIGKYLSCGDIDLETKELSQFDFKGTDIALFSAGSEIAKQYAHIAASKGCIVIDNSSCFRWRDDIPLIVPEVNGDDISNYLNHNIIANPNCAVIQLVTALKPLNDYIKIEKVVVSTYQSVSGAGLKAMDELYNQTKLRFAGNPGESEVLPRQIAFNVIPQIGEFQENGFTDEECKVMAETRKILRTEEMNVEATCVRVPVFIGHSESVYVEFQKEIDIDKIKKILSNAPGIIVMEHDDYVTPIECVSLPMVYISRIRQSLFSKHGLHMWIVSDNLYKGAALNAVQIAEELVHNHL